jgi:hypothetical protein
MANAVTKDTDELWFLLRERLAQSIVGGLSALSVISALTIRNVAPSHLIRRLFGAMLRRIWALPVPTG